jgi:ADP-ribosylglycohydrolase
MDLSLESYRDKVRGCWLGKNIGGTLGAPFEWLRQRNNVSFYTEDLGGLPFANDDLDIQLLWLMALEKHGADYESTDSRTLARYFSHFVNPFWAEYGMAKVNLGRGLLPPFSGDFNNPYKDSCGSFIRTEIWACIAPGAPELAARFAYNDSIIDHAHGEGTVAALFVAALESAAFVCSDARRLIDGALESIGPETGVARAVRFVESCFDSGKEWTQARDGVLDGYRGYGIKTSEAEKRLGREEGPLGWDAPSNMGMLAIGLLYGGDDFGRTICTAVNCGEDTDCTGATAGSIWGIIHGGSAIPEEWKKPIGDRIVTMCLDIGDFGLHGHVLPKTIEELSVRVEAICRQVSYRYGVQLPFAAGGIEGKSLVPAHPAPSRPDLSSLATTFASDFLVARVSYPQGYVFEGEEPKEVRIRFESRWMASNYARVVCHAAPALEVLPSAEQVLLMKDDFYYRGSGAELKLSVRQRKKNPGIATFMVEVSMPGMPSLISFPVSLLSDEGAGPEPSSL